MKNCTTKKLQAFATQQNVVWHNADDDFHKHHQQLVQRQKQQQDEIFDCCDFSDCSTVLNNCRRDLDSLHDKLRVIFNLHSLDQAKVPLIGSSLYNILEEQNKDIFKHSDAIMLIREASDAIDIEQSRRDSLQLKISSMMSGTGVGVFFQEANNLLSSSVAGSAHYCMECELPGGIFEVTCAARVFQCACCQPF